ncbi:hypothetical protein IQ07DRAFT_644440 [Pyrenochaeta sp. DS3sAY3a]|nr:hypothetical protein IQ07DRAFT_644440 [Pyrenochaeta sp. DS3sAY3a]
MAAWKAAKTFTQERITKPTKRHMDRKAVENIGLRRLYRKGNTKQISTSVVQSLKGLWRRATKGTTRTKTETERKGKEKESGERHSQPASDTTDQIHKSGSTSHLDEAQISQRGNEYPPSITPTEASTSAVVGEHVEVTRRPARITSTRQSTSSVQKRSIRTAEATESHPSDDSLDQSPDFIIVQLENFRFTPVTGTLNIMAMSNRHAQIQMAGSKLLTVCNDLERLSILLGQLNKPHPLLNSNAMAKLRGEVHQAVIYYHRWIKRIDAFRKWDRSKELMGQGWWETIDTRLEALKDLDVEHIKARIESLITQRDSAPPNTLRRLSGSQASQSRSRASKRSSHSRSTAPPISNRASRPNKRVTSTRGSHPSSLNSITTSIIEGVQFVAKARGKTYFRRTPCSTFRETAVTVLFDKAVKLAKSSLQLSRLRNYHKSEA